MTNVETKVTGKILTITIDISQDHGPSSSGKTTIVGSTNGNQEVAPGVYLGVNCYKKK
jgi:hypothetical protein